MNKKSSNKSKTNTRKNRKGFTLVELIAVISIMAVVSTVAIATFVGVSRSVRQKEYESVVSSIQAGAMNFYEATNIKKFYVQTLIDYGILSTNNNNYEITNPVDETSMNCYIINIDEDDKAVVSKNSDCSNDLYEATTPKVLTCNDNKVFNQDIWHNKSEICLKADLPDEFKSKGISITSTQWCLKSDTNSCKTFSSDNYTLKFNGTDYSNKDFEGIFTLKLTLSDPTISTSETTIKVKNDLVKPTVETSSGINCGLGSKLNVTYNDSGSGLSSVKLVSGSTNYEDNQFDNPKLFEKEYNITSSGNYSFVVTDKAGNYINLSKYISVDTPEVDYNLVVKDTDDKDYVQNSWSSKGLRFKIDGDWGNDECAGTINYCIDQSNGTCTPNNIINFGDWVNNLTDKSGEYYIHYIIKNNARTIDETYKVLIDQTTPECTLSGENDKWTAEDVTITYGAKEGISDTYVVGTSPSVRTKDVKYSTSLKTSTINSYSIKNSAGKTTTCDAKSVNIYLDKESPTIEDVSVTGKSSITITLTVEAKDNLSGIYKIEYYVNDTKSNNDTLIDPTDPAHNQYPLEVNDIKTINLNQFPSASIYVFTVKVYDATYNNDELTEGVNDIGIYRFGVNFIDYYKNSGSDNVYNMPVSQYKMAKESIVLSSLIPRREGYTFKSWNTKPDGTGTRYDPDTNYSDPAELYLYAQWEKNATVVYTITYDKNTTDTVNNMPSAQTKTHGTALTLSSNTPTRTGYNFLGWSESSSATTAQYSAGGSYTTEASKTLYAVWARNTYTISYNKNAGSDTVNNMPSSQTKTHGTALILSSNTPTRTGYTFAGWSDSSSATTAQYSAGGSYTTEASKTLYAVWARNTYSVTYYKNTTDTVSNMPSSQTKTHGTILTLSSNTPTRAGYVFAGWATSSSSTTVSYQPSATYSTNAALSLYAVWVSIANPEITLYQSTNSYPALSSSVISTYSNMTKISGKDEYKTTVDIANNAVLKWNIKFHDTTKDKITTLSYSEFNISLNNGAGKIIFVFPYSGRAVDYILFGLKSPSEAYLKYDFGKNTEQFAVEVTVTRDGNKLLFSNIHKYTIEGDYTSGEWTNRRVLLLYKPNSTSNFNLIGYKINGASSLTYYNFDQYYNATSSSGSNHYIAAYGNHTTSGGIGTSTKSDTVNIKIDKTPPVYNSTNIETNISDYLGYFGTVQCWQAGGGSYDTGTKTVYYSNTRPTSFTGSSYAYRGASKGTCEQSGSNAQTGEYRYKFVEYPTSYEVDSTNKTITLHMCLLANGDNLHNVKTFVDTTVFDPSHANTYKDMLSGMDASGYTLTDNNSFRSGNSSYASMSSNDSCGYNEAPCINDIRSVAVDKAGNSFQGYTVRIVDHYYYYMNWNPEYYANTQGKITEQYKNCGFLSSVTSGSKTIFGTKEQYVNGTWTIVDTCQDSTCQKFYSDTVAQFNYYNSLYSTNCDYNNLYNSCDADKCYNYVCVNSKTKNTTACNRYSTIKAANGGTFCKS